MKNVISLIRIMVCLAFLLNIAAIADAENLELTKQFSKDWESRKVRIVDLISDDNKKTHYEDDTVSIDVLGYYGYSHYWDIGGVRTYIDRKIDNQIYVIDQGMLGGNAYVLAIKGVILSVTNKTDEVMIIDLNKTLISVGEYSGRPVATGVKYIESQTAMLPPIIIPPSANKETILHRGDYIFDDRDKIWQAPMDLHLDTNVFGCGDFVIAIGDKDTKYIAFKCESVLTRDIFKDYIRKKK